MHVFKESVFTMDQIVVTPFLLFEQEDSTQHRNIPEIELTLAFKQIYAEKPKRKQIKAISKIFIPFWLVPIDDSQGIALAAFEGLSSKLNLPIYSFLDPKRELEAEGLNEFIQRLQYFSRQVSNNSRGKMQKVRIDNLPSPQFLDDIRILFKERHPGLGRGLEKAISPEITVEPLEAKEGGLEWFPSKHMLHSIDNQKVKVQEIVNKWLKIAQSHQKQLEQRYEREAARIEEFYEKKIEENENRKEKQIQEQDERFRRGIPQRFPDPPKEFSSQVERIKKITEEIINATIQKNSERAAIRCQEARRDVKDLDDFITSFTNRLTLYNREKEEFQRDIQREKDHIENDFKSTKRNLEKERENELTEKRTVLDELKVNLEILEEIKNKLFVDYQEWKTNVDVNISIESSRLAPIQHTEYKEGQSSIIYLSVYGAEFANKKIAFIGPLIMEEKGRQKFKHLNSIDDVLSTIQKKLSKNTRKQISEILEANNLLRDIEAVEKLKKGAKTLERSEFFSHNEAVELIRNYDRQFLT